MKSIRGQLTLMMLGGFGLLLLASGAAIYYFTRLALLKEFDAGLRAKALTIMSQTEGDHGGIQVELPDTIFPGGNDAVFPRFYEVWQTNGVRCARAEAMADTDLPCRTGSLAQPVYWDLDLPGDRDGRAIGLTFNLKTEDGEPTPKVPVQLLLVVAADRHDLDATLATLATVLITAGLLTGLITVPLVRYAVQRGHAPLGQLAQQTAAITADSLQTRFPVATLPAELHPIARRLNDLLARLEDSFERERRFSADLAHELRTPLAELRTLAEVELAWPEGGEPARHAETLAIALQMETMVARLLELARCENGKVPLKLEAVPLAALVEEVWQVLAGRAKERELAIHFDIPPDAIILTDRAMLRAILVNLLANLVEYTPAGGRGEIRWHPKAGELKFSNPAGDLTAADLPHLFERLWRKDPARSGGEHCGLGLALSRAMAKALGASLAARLGEDRVLTMVLRWERR
jgi:two-component system sensor histidine kinase QseC